MADNKMLIDASHPEETRVVVLREGRVEEFDYESAARKLLRGSIFLSKITRVEPSLQAAFVDYGGNRHGFLAFNEIHPDYYQIPHADRQALLEAEFGYQSTDDDDEDEHPVETKNRRSSKAASETREVEPDEQEASSDSAAGSDAADDLDTNVGDTGDQPDFEAEAIDVSHLLPAEPAEELIDTPNSPEANAEPEQGETRAQIASIDADHTNEETEASQADVDQTDAVAETSAEVSTESESAEEAGTGGDDDAPSKKPPRTIAAATPPDDRVISDPVEEATVAEDSDTEQEPADEAEAPQDTQATVTAESSPDAGSDDQIEPDQTATAQAAEDSPDEAEAVAEEDTPETAASTEADGASAASDEQDNDDDLVEARSDEVIEADDDDNGDEDAIVDEVGDSDALEEVPTRKRRRVRNYKIQEVIKRRQIVLVQVVKEERGNKGAALTTYLSLAGRYTVLMPNTARGGGISRKITNIQDRKRLKAIAQELDVPEGMGLIIRTAGAARTKQEIKRDFEYLLRLWESVRDLTLRSTAPSLVYEEGDLIKRSIRDLYSRDVEQVLVSGDEAYKEAKSFMRMLMPSHAKNVVKYDDAQPLFTRYRIEQQLNAMFSPFVQLKSGGYLVINQTEALVAVDVNSGKSTRKFSIEDTALNTNLEAAEELTRQLKLRDLAGLIVIDFIDMEEKRNNRAVERRLKECLRDDRARIQVGRISHFGLLEMSRQRLRTGVLEGSTMPCQHCQGTGIIRSTESVALAVLRGLEDQLMSGQPRPVAALCSRDAAMYLLNQKREFVQEIEARYGVSVHIEASDDHQGADFAIQRRNGPPGQSPPRRVEKSAVNVEAGFAEENEERSDTKAVDAEAGDGDERRPRRRRRRRGRRGDGEGANDQIEAGSDAAEEADADATTSEAAAPEAEDGDTEQGERQPRRRRRGRRGGRNSRGQRRGNGDSVAEPGAPQPDIGDGETETWAAKPDAAAPATTADDAEEPAVDVETAATAGSTASSEPEVARAATEDKAMSDDSDRQHEEAVTAAATPSAEIDTPASETDDAAESEASADEPIEAIEETTEDAAIEEATAAGDAAPPAPRGEPASSAPVLERVVMTPENGGTETAGTEQAVKEEPARKGWWQRSFGG